VTSMSTYITPQLVEYGTLVDLVLSGLESATYPDSSMSADHYSSGALGST
jgi:hypothetical protein